MRCHKIAGRGGDVGPDLSKIGGEKTRAYLLESIVLPNKAIAKNFESVEVVGQLLGVGHAEAHGPTLLSAPCPPGSRRSPS